MRPPGSGRAHVRQHSGPLLVALVHTGAMALSGGALAVGMYPWFGIRFLTRGWFNLDMVWALSLVLVGGVGAAAAFA